MTDRDQFAAAALTGLLISRTADEMGELCGWAYDWADAMLAERDKTPAQVEKHRVNVTTGDTSPERVAPQPYRQHDEKRILSDTNGDAYGQANTTDHDAVPAARATADSVGTDKAEPLTRQQTGNPGERSGTGTLTERELDALQGVVEDGEIRPVAKRQECHANADTPSRGDTLGTPKLHTTPSEGSVPSQRTVGEELTSRLQKMNDAIEREPVAWAVMIGATQYDVYDTSGEAEAIAQWLRDYDEDDWKAVPLYSHPPQDRVVQLPRSWAKLDDCEMVGVKRVTAALDAAGVNWRFG